MLVLTRKPGQALVLTTSNGVVVIRSLAHDRIAIDAPDGVSVLREELHGAADTPGKRRKRG
jgi:sRNA-binding carbon storage regulator CsrA